MAHNDQGSVRLPILVKGMVVLTLLLALIRLLP